MSSLMKLQSALWGKSHWGWGWGGWTGVDHGTKIYLYVASLRGKLGLSTARPSQSSWNTSMAIGFSQN